MGFRARGTRRVLAAAGAGGLAVVILASSALAETDSVRFEYGGNGTWTVPDRVTEIEVEVAGGGGGGSDFAAITGGDGALVKAAVSTAGGETLSIAVGGGGDGRVDGSTGGGGGGGASRVTSSSPGLADLLLIAGGGGGAGRGDGEARSSSGGDAGVNSTNGAGANSSRVDGYSVNGRRGVNGNGGFSNIPSFKGLNYVAGSGTDTGEGGGRKVGDPGALVGGAGSSAWNDAGRGGAGYGGGGAGGRGNTDGIIYALGGGGGGSTAQGAAVEFVSGETTYYSSAGGAGGSQGAGRNGWVVITWVIPAPLPDPDLPAVTTLAQREPAVLQLVMPEDISCAAPTSKAAGAWIQLPTEDDCANANKSATRSIDEPGLLGWATTPDFPVSIAQRQVDNGWGAYEVTDEQGQITSVFIPVGGSAEITADTRLFPVFAAQLQR